MPEAPDPLAQLARIVESELALGHDAAELRRELVRGVHARHQFATVNRATETRLERACEETLAGERDPRALASLALELIAPGQRAVVCADYDPDLQLAVLGLDPDDLASPVLDLGCGYEARLVAALRARGVDATGIDRHLRPGLGIEADFLEHPLGTDAWGTIVSHQAFSLHFIHHHLASAETAARYAERMLAIVRALRPGGTFAYAPGLPFFEPLLARAGLGVERRELPLAVRVGDDVAYACRITRP